MSVKGGVDAQSSHLFLPASEKQPIKTDCVNIHILIVKF